MASRGLCSEKQEMKDHIGHFYRKMDDGSDSSQTVILAACLPSVGMK